MTDDLKFEAGTEQRETGDEWGMHNGLVVLAALGLVALSVLLDWVRDTEIFAGTPVWVNGFLSSMGFVLMLAAGGVIGMLLATRMLDVHVGPGGARKLALWGFVAIVLTLLLQTVTLVIDLRLQDAGRPLIFAVQSLSNLLTATMAIGAAMVALAFVGRLSR